MARKNITPETISEERRAAFWTHVARGEEDECWLWLGSKTKGGYGQFSVGGRKHGMEGAHRIAWLILSGPIPNGMHILHNCPGGDNRACVNVRHLSIGTEKENAQDAVLKGRYQTGDNHWARRTPEKVARGDRHGKRTKPSSILRGEAVGTSVLTETTVTAIRNKFADGGTLDQLASEYDVDRSTIHLVVRRKRWTHLP